MSSTVVIDLLYTIAEQHNTYYYTRGSCSITEITEQTTGV